MMDTSDTIAFWALLVAAAAFIVSSVIAAVAAWWSARSARAGETSARAAKTSAEYAGEAIALAREQLALSTEATASAARSAAAAEESTSVAREALDGLHAQTAIARESADVARSARDWEDRPRFEVVPHAQPDGERWLIDVEMTGGPPRIEARWLHQGEVLGPSRSVPGSAHEVRQVSLVLGAPGGPTFLHKGSGFQVAVECMRDASVLDVTLTIASIELDPDTDEPTLRQWPHKEQVTAESPPFPQVF